MVPLVSDVSLSPGEVGAATCVYGPPFVVERFT